MKRRLRPLNMTRDAMPKQQVSRRVEQRGVCGHTFPRYVTNPYRRAAKRSE